MEKRYTPHLFKLVLLVLIISAVVMYSMAYRSISLESDYHNKSLTRSADATVREIELYIGGLQRALQLFVIEQHLLLKDTLKAPANPIRLRDKISQHFPEHLAFALSDPHLTSPLASAPGLFGEHCRANLAAYGDNMLSRGTELSLHTAEPFGSEHFDVMVSIDKNQQTGERLGVLFVSFRINDLQRLLKAGSSNSYTLALSDSATVEIGNRDMILLSPQAYFDTRVANDTVPQLNNAKYSVKVDGTPWVLLGFLDTDETTRVKHAFAMQLTAGSFALLIAGFSAWRSVEQEKINRNRTAIVLDSVEAERKRIARDLHDQVLSDVSHTKRLLMDIESDDRDLSAIAHEKFNAIQGSVERFSANIRTAIDNLYPHTLENLGLCRALESYARHLCSPGTTLTIQCDSHTEKYLTPIQQLHIYRIVAELINDAMMHSECTSLTFSINRQADSIKLVFEDDGKGFDATASRKLARHGLTNIESRAATLKATTRWIRKAGRGSCFELILPVSASVSRR